MYLSIKFDSSSVVNQSEQRQLNLDDFSFYIWATERSGGAESGACGGANGGMLAERFLGKREQALQ